MERDIEPKNRSKVEIPGMASTSSEVSDLPIKKIANEGQTDVCNAEVPDSNGSGSEDVDQLPSKLLEQLGRAANDEASSYPFRHMLDEYMAAYCPNESGIDDPREEKFYDVVDPEEKGENQTSAIQENLTSRYFQETKNFWRTSSRVGDDFSAILEFSGDNVFPTDSSQSNCGLQVSFYKSFEPQFHPFDTAYKMEVPMKYLKSPSLGLIREESSIGMADPLFPDRGGIRTAPHGGVFHGERPPSSQSGPRYLEVYLADYLRSVEPFKTNNFQVDISENRGCHKCCGGDTQNEKEEFFEVAEIKSASSFASALSFCTQASGAIRTIAEADQCLQKFLSLTQLTEKSNGSKRSKSEGDLSGSKTAIAEKEARLYAMANEPNDSYEKIQPFRVSKASSEGKKCGRGGLLLSGFETEGRAMAVGEDSEDNDDDDDDDDDDFGVSKFQDRIRWSPTLPELTEIYLRILKDNKKILQRGAMAEPCFSSYMMSLLQRKLQEKKYKMDLIDFSKSFRDSFRPKDWKPGISKDPNFGLEEYVAAFQEILHSNLSVDQITRLNIALARFQDYHDKTHRYLRRMARKQEEREKKKKTKEEEEEFKSEVQSRTKTHCKEVSSKEETKKIKLPGQRNLETVLKTFNVEAPGQQASEVDKSKLLVTVELSGNDVLVNNLSYIENEASPLLEKHKNKSTSQLIIENWTNSKDASPIRRGMEPKVKGSRMTTGARLNDRFTVEFVQQDQQEQRELAKEVPEFEYDQLLLRTQHPIEAIMEGSESKLDKTQENSEEKLKSKSNSEGNSEIPQENSTAIKDVLQKALEGKIYLKDLFYELGYTEEEFGKTINRVVSLNERPQPKMRSSWPKKKADTVRSMFDLKKSPSGKGTKPRSTYLCYPSVMNFQEKVPKKKIKDKRRYSAPQASPATTGFRVKQNKNTPRSPNKGEVTKKTPKEPEPVRVESELPGTTLDVGTTTGEEQSVQQASNVPEGTSECCSIELLVTDESRSAFFEVQGEPPEDPPRESDASQQAVVAATPSKENSEFVLHCSKSDADGMSFRSEIIHSDSFLKYCTPIRVTHSKLKSLFKCSSDFKFYPGRVCESSEDTEPFITFVLTPTQNETADLPGHMVQVVQKDIRHSAAGPLEDEEEAESQQGSLEEIERFVMEMARLKKESLKRQKEMTNQRKITPVRTDTRSSLSGSRASFTGHSAERRPFYDSQKKKTSNVQIGRPKSPRVATPGAKQSQTSWGGLETDKPEGAFDDFIKKTCEAFSQFFKDKQHEMQEMSGQEMQRREKMQDKATEMSSSTSKIEAIVTDITQTDLNPSSERNGEYDNVSIVPKDLLQAIKSAIGRVDGFDGKEQIIAAIEDVESRPKKVESEAAKKADDEATAPPNPTKKSKTIKIKIRCKGHKCTGKSDEASREVDTEDEIDKKGPSPPAKEIKLLDSLLSSDTGGSTLDTRNSTYFDAVEKGNERDESTEEVPINSQILCEETVEDVIEATTPPSPGFSGMQNRSYPSLTLSDERLLTAVSFEKENEEKIYKKISKYLEKGEVSYSMTLLDMFLRKTENSLDDVDSRLRLNDLLLLVENKSRNLMMNLEKNAWIKVLSLLEEASRVLNDDGIKHHKKTQLVEKIQALNIRKLAALQGCCSSESISTESWRQGNIFRVIRESFSFLKRKVVRKRSRCNGTEKVSPWENTENSNSAIGIHSTNGYPEMREALVRYNSNYLKRRLHQQRARIERLMNANGDLITPKIGDLKNIVMMKMKSLEHYNMGESSRGEAYSRGSLRGRGTYLGTGRKRDGRRGPRESLSRRPGYVDLVRYFMKAWDARMSLSSLSNCRS